jgi:hypothetical protein
MLKIYDQRIIYEKFISSKMSKSFIFVLNNKLFL